VPTDTNDAAAIASDACTLATLPTRPTVTPLNVRRPARRRMEFLKGDPVADDVLDVVRHHRQHERQEIGAITR
jgi:hypothetical protein